MLLRDAGTWEDRSGLETCQGPVGLLCILSDSKTIFDCSFQSSEAFSQQDWQPEALFLRKKSLTYDSANPFLRLGLLPKNKVNPFYICPYFFFVSFFTFENLLWVSFSHLVIAAVVWKQQISDDYNWIVVEYKGTQKYFILRNFFIKHKCYFVDIRAACWPWTFKKPWTDRWNGYWQQEVLAPELPNCAFDLLAICFARLLLTWQEQTGKRKEYTWRRVVLWFCCLDSL